MRKKPSEIMSCQKGAGSPRQLTVIVLYLDIELLRFIPSGGLKKAFSFSYNSTQMDITDCSHLRCTIGCPLDLPALGLKVLPECLAYSSAHRYRQSVILTEGLSP